MQLLVLLQVLVQPLVQVLQLELPLLGLLLVQLQELLVEQVLLGLLEFLQLVQLLVL